MGRLSSLTSSLLLSSQDKEAAVHIVKQNRSIMDKPQNRIDDCMLNGLLIMEMDNNFEKDKLHKRYA